MSIETLFAGSAVAKILDIYLKNQKEEPQYSLDEIAELSNIHYGTTSKAVNMLEKMQILVISGRNGRMRYYRLNYENSTVVHLINFYEGIISTLNKNMEYEIANTEIDMKFKKMEYEIDMKFKKTEYEIAKAEIDIKFKNTENEIAKAENKVPEIAKPESQEPIEEIPLKTVQELREHLKPLMENRNGGWYNPFSELIAPVPYAYRSQAIDSAIKFFMSYYYGKKRRNDKLGAEWDVIIV